MIGREELARKAEIVTPPENDGIAFEYCYDGRWRAYDQHGLVASAPTWREVWERTGRRWQ